MIELNLLIQIIIELAEWHKELKLLEQQNEHIIHLSQQFGLIEDPMGKMEMELSIFSLQLMMLIKIPMANDIVMIRIIQFHIRNLVQYKEFQQTMIIQLMIGFHMVG